MTGPAKTVAKTFRAMGAKVADHTRHGTSYRFPDDATKLVPDNISPATARNMLSWAKDRYGYVENRLPFQGEKTGRRKPILDLNRLTASTHAKERLELMRRQDAVTHSEILLALRTPQRTLWSEKHQSWIWVGERVAVAAFVHADGSAVISTILWATRELWDANPRPEMSHA